MPPPGFKLEIGRQSDPREPLFARNINIPGVCESGNGMLKTVFNSMNDWLLGNIRGCHSKQSLLKTIRYALPV